MSSRTPEAFVPATTTAMTSKAEKYKQAVEYALMRLPGRSPPLRPLTRTLFLRAQGNAAFASGSLELALANFTTALQLDPSVAAYPLNRAAVHLKLRNWAAAEKDATTAANLDGGSNPKALFRRALARRHLGKLLQARAGAL